MVQSLFCFQTPNKSSRSLTTLAWAVLLALTGCSANPSALNIVKEVDPLPPVEISQICIDLKSGDESEFANDLFKSVEALGFKTMAKQAAFTGECQYSLSYSVSWSGSLAKWPLLIKVTIYDGRQQIGHIRYDATRGSGRPDKYGSAIGKLEPLLANLFARVQR